MSQVAAEPLLARLLAVARGLVSAHWLAVYLAVVLNVQIFGRRAIDLAQQHDIVVALMRTALDLGLVYAFTLGLLTCAELAGHWIRRMIWSLLLVVSVLASYYMTFFDVVIGFGVVQAVFTTDIDLSKEVVGFGLVAWFSMLALPLLWLIWTSRREFSGVAPFLKNVAYRLLLAVLLFAGSYKLLNGMSSEPLKVDEVHIKPAVLAAHSYVPSNWMAGVAMSASNLYSGWMQSRQLKDPAKAFTYQGGNHLDDVLVVMVIGESARSTNLGLLGYQRETTPLLEKMEGVVAFPGHSCNTSTKLSLQCMFVRPSSVEDRGLNPPVVYELPVFSVFKQLGFQINLFAMQSEVGFYNSVFADFYKIRELIASDPKNIGKPSHDGLLLNEVQDAIKRQKPGKHLIVLHTKGSHYLYTSRYPREFAKYQPECRGIDSRCTHEQLINSYDNSILYLDHFLFRLTRELKDKKALVVYTSDHGESIGDNMHFHATPKPLAPPEQFAVPLIFWASPGFLEVPSLAKKFQALQSNRRGLDPTNATEKVGHHNLFDSLLGCLAIDSPNGGLEPTLNLCHSQ